MIAAYVTYRLLFIGRDGHQPYGQVASMGMELEGGMMGIDGRMMGYIHCKKGDEGRVDEVISALSAWSFRRMTEEEALKWSDRAIPVGTQSFGVAGPGFKTCQYGAASLSVDGRIEKLSTEVADVKPE